MASKLREVLAQLKEAYRTNDLGFVQTFVSESSSIGITPSQMDSGFPASQDGRWNSDPQVFREKELPLPDSNRIDKNQVKVYGPAEYNKPDHYTPRTIPEHEWGAHPWKDNTVYPTRRVEARANPFPQQRQKNQKGVSRQRSKQYYLKNRSKIKLKMRKRYRKQRRNPQFKRKRKYYQQYPNRYKRKGFGFDTPAQRSREWRRQQKQGTMYETNTLRTVREILANHHRDSGHARESDLFRQVVGPASVRTLSPMTPGIPEDNSFSLRAPNLSGRPKGTPGLESRKTPAQKVELPYKPNPTDGSGKVIPWGQGNQKDTYVPLDNGDRFLRNAPETRYAGLVKKVAARYLKAYTMAQIQRATEQLIHDRADGIKPRLVGKAPKQDRWKWKVKDYDIFVQANPTGKGLKVRNMNVDVSCTCPAWVWQGPEYWAHEYGYLYGNPRGSLTPPNIRDPNEVHFACKHVVAVLREMRDASLADLRKK